MTSFSQADVADTIARILTDADKQDRTIDDSSGVRISVASGALFSGDQFRVNTSDGRSFMVSVTPAQD